MRHRRKKKTPVRRKPKTGHKYGKAAHGPGPQDEETKKRKPNGVGALREIRKQQRSVKFAIRWAGEPSG